jgi:dynein heavy chain, axonemal
MKSSLRELVRAIKGEVVMSSELEKMYNCFVFHKVPAAWEEAGYPCLKPLLGGGLHAAHLFYE